MLLMLTACTGKREAVSYHEEGDPVAMRMLQGIWTDAETDIPLLRVEGDSIYYADPQSLPVRFKVVHDSIYLFSTQSPVAYKIDKQSEWEFWFHAQSDDVVKLYKSEDVSDALFFRKQQVEVIASTPQVIRKDSVILYNGVRYRGYAYINPSSMKVMKTSYSEGGLAVENVYYDNVIHICVYEGKKLLYGQDVQKQLFASLFPDNYLSQTILSDMNFVAIDQHGFHYEATLGIPETQVYYLVHLTITPDKQLVMALDKE